MTQEEEETLMNEMLNWKIDVQSNFILPSSYLKQNSHRLRQVERKIQISENIPYIRIWNPKIENK